MRSVIGKVALVAAVVALAACGKHTSGAHEGDDMGTHASMAIASDGNLYVSYYWRSHKVTANHDEKVGALMFARGSVAGDNSVHWAEPEYVEGDVRIKGQSDVGEYTSLALGSDKQPRISYYDKKLGDLKFAVKKDGKWATESVDTTGNVGGYTSLVLENDNPRIAYYDFDKKALKLAVKNGTGPWTITTVDDGNAGANDVGKWCSLAKDGNGGLGIAYYDATNGNLGYIAGNATGFPAAATATEWLDTDGDVGRWPKLVYDLGSPRIAYQDYTNQHLKFAKKDGQGAWAVETVDNTQWTGADTSIAIDHSGKITIAYFDGLNNDALSARWDGNAWTLGKVAQEGANGYFNNVVLDAQGAPVFGWYTYTGNTFRGVRIP